MGQRCSSQAAREAWANSMHAAPLSLAHAGFFLCDPASARTLSFAARNLALPTVSEHGFPPIGGSNAAAGKITGPIALAALGLPATGDVIYSPRMDGTFSDPVKWVVDMVKKYSPGHDAAA